MIAKAEFSTSQAERFAAVLADALQQLDIEGRLSADAARVLHQAIACSDRDTTAAVAFNPELHLGPFDTLPLAARNAIVESIVDRDRSEVLGFGLGGWYPLLLRLLWRLKHRVYRFEPRHSRFARTAREIVDVLAYGTRKAPAFVIGLLHRRWLSARARLSSRPRLLEVLSRAAIDPRNFAVCYARHVPQEDRYRGYWHDKSQQVTVGRVLGIDMLRAADGWWFVESNASPALEAARSALYQRDPMVRNLLDFAAEHAYRHLVVLDNTSSGIDPTMAKQYAEEAQARRIRLSIPALPNVPGKHPVRSYGIPSITDKGTLVVRIRSYPTSVDHLLGMKRATYRALALYQRETGDLNFRLPATGPDPMLDATAPEDPFPNVVYKLPDIEQGRGVYFFKAYSAEHARELVTNATRSSQGQQLQERVLHAFTNKQGLYQAYVRSRMLKDRRLYKVRALVLVTPVGVKFLSAHRAVSPWSVPEQLDSGIVEDPRAYLINVARGGRLTICPPDEEREVSRAALAIGRGFVWAAEYGFQTA